MKTMSDTPRTDNEVEWLHNAALENDQRYIVTAEFARKLELELAALRVIHSEHLDRSNKLWVQNKALLADKARLVFLDFQIWPDQPRPNYTPPIVQLVVKALHDPNGEWVNVTESGRSALDAAMRANPQPKHE